MENGGVYHGKLLFFMNSSDAKSSIRLNHVESNWETNFKKSTAESSVATNLITSFLFLEMLSSTSIKRRWEIPLGLATGIENPLKKWRFKWEDRRRNFVKSCVYFWETHGNAFLHMGIEKWKKSSELWGFSGKPWPSGAIQFTLSNGKDYDRTWETLNRYFTGWWWLEPWNFMTVHSVGNFNIPTDFQSMFFQRGRRKTTNQSSIKKKPSTTNLQAFSHQSSTIHFWSLEELWHYRFHIIPPKVRTVTLW